MELPYFPFLMGNWQKHAIGPFIHIKDHVLLPQATLLEEVNKDFKRILTEEKIREIVGLVPTIGCIGTIVPVRLKRYVMYISGS